MRTSLLLGLTALLGTTSAMAGEITIVDKTSRAILLEIQGDAAQALFNLIVAGDSEPVVTGPVRKSVSKTVEGKNVSCSKAGSDYKCNIIAMPGGELLPLTEIGRD